MPLFRWRKKQPAFDLDVILEPVIELISIEPPTLLVVKNDFFRPYHHKVERRHVESRKREEFGAEETKSVGSVEKDHEEDSSEDAQATPLFDEYDTDEEKKAEITFECDICLSICSVDERFWSFSCDHEERYCVNCMLNHVDVDLQGFRGVSTCPCPGCPAIIPYHAIIELKDPDAQMKYHRKLFRIAMGDRFIECPKCTRPVAAPGPTCYQGKCPYCFQKFCGKCLKKKPKKNHVCDFTSWVARERVKPKFSIGRYHQTHAVKRCPRCGAAAQKVNGCPMVICGMPMCGNRFNWNRADKMKSY